MQEYFENVSLVVFSPNFPKENRLMCFTWLGDPRDTLLVHDKKLQSQDFFQDFRMPDKYVRCISLHNLTSRAAEFEYIHINKE